MAVCCPQQGWPGRYSHDSGPGPDCQSGKTADERSLARQFESCWCSGSIAIFVWGLFRLTLRQNKLAVANDRHHHRRFIELLRTTVLDTAHAAIESKTSRLQTPGVT